MTTQTDQISRRRSGVPYALPVLSMVDAFVGGVSVILILVLLIDPAELRTDNEPRADIVITCSDDRRSVSYFQVDNENARMPLGQTSDFDSLPELLEAHADPAALSLRVILDGTAVTSRCLARIESILAIANSELGTSFLSGDVADPGHPVFMIDRHLSPITDETAQ